MTRPFFERIARAAIEKKSPIVLALDPRPSDNQRLPEIAARTICAVEHHVCAVKMNFHIILPLSASEISAINKLAHSFGLQSIADIKLNDIETTNAIAVDHLTNMCFYAAIANPFIGGDALASLVQKAHKADAGIIALVYMSHPEAKEVAGLLPVYSPGVGAQGGDAEQAIRNGANYLIIGRSIVESRQPAKAAREIQNRISSIGK